MNASVNSLLSKLTTGLARHRGKPPSVVLEKAVRAGAAMALAPWMLRACDRVGPRARSVGRTIVDNRGRISIGADFAANCPFCAVELATAPGGVLTMGDQVVINYGTTITATREIRLGDRVSIGPYCILCDTDSPAPLDAPPDGRGRPIVLEDDVWLAGRVTVLPGAHIGAGATVSAGSVVSGYIPPGTVASGIPARALRVTGARKAVVPEQTAHLRGLVLTDFPATELCARLREEDPPLVDAQTELFEGPPSPGKAPFDGDVALVWTTAEGALPGLKDLLSGAPYEVGEPRAVRRRRAPGDIAASIEEVLADVDANATLLAERLASCPCVLVPTWVVAPELRSPAVARVLAAANARLAERLAEILPAARVIDASRFCAGPEAWSPIMMYSTGIPFSPEVFAGAARDVKDAIREARGEVRTALFVDTPPPAGDTASHAAAQDLEQALSALRFRGIAVHRTEMGSLPAPESLGLSPSTCVWVALDIAARARAREAFPDMLVPEVPSDPLLLARSIRSLRALGGA